MNKIIDKVFKEGVELPAGKSKTTYIILALLFGWVGGHNFWAGAQEKAKYQLIAGLVLGLCCLCVPMFFVSTIWIIADIMHVKEAM